MQPTWQKWAVRGFVGLAAFELVAAIYVAHNSVAATVWAAYLNSWAKWTMRENA